MAHDNEHITLRRRMAARLGRPISPTAWDVASERRYVADALDPEYESGEDDLAAFLGDLLRVQDRARRPASRRTRSGEPRIMRTPALSARIEAVSRLAAEHAAGDEDVIRFRQRVLGRDAPMSPDEAEAYLELPEARELPPSRESGPAHTEVFRYQNRRVFYDFHVWPRTPLDQLRQLAVSLCRSYPWQPAQAAAFVLEGLMPRATPFMVNLPQTWHDTRPRREKLIMEVDLWMPASVVLRAYREYQRKVLPGHNRPVGLKSINLVNFVLCHQPATWQKLLDGWNTEHPATPYPDYRRFRYAYERARQSLLNPGYRFHIEPDA